MEKYMFSFGKTQKSFTLAEVLITLVVIGIIAAITVPSINKQIRKQQYKSSLFKAISTINQATLKYRNMMGDNPICGYWKKNPYSSKGQVAKCDERMTDGRCGGYSLYSGEDKIAEDLPRDYNGHFNDCGELWKSYYSTIVSQKICKTRAYEQGCIPDYKGRENIYMEQNPDASTYDMNVAISASGFSQNSIRNGAAIVLNDGTIIFSYVGPSAQYIAIDVNGHKGPNKWGTDVHTIMPKIATPTSIPVFVYNDSMLEKGSIKNKDLLYK